MSAEYEEKAGLTKLRRTYERMADVTIRHGETGWRFHDMQGRAFALSDAEGEALRRAAQDRIDALFSGMTGSSWTLFIPVIMVMVLGLRMINEFALAHAMPSFVYFLPCVVLLFGDALAEISFLFAMMRWREEQAQILRQRDGREHETATYAWMFDPRLLQWTTYGLYLAAAIMLLVMAGAPPLATGLVALGTALLGGALSGSKAATS